MNRNGPSHDNAGLSFSRHDAGKRVRTHTLTSAMHGRTAYRQYHCVVVLINIYITFGARTKLGVYIVHDTVHIRDAFRTLCLITRLDELEMILPKGFEKDVCRVGASL